MLRILFPIYQFICIFGVLYFSWNETITCGNGISWNSYIVYGAYGVITFILEADLFVFCLKYVRHLIPEFKPDCRGGFPYAQINNIKLMLVDWQWINLWYMNYSISFI